MPMKIAKSTFNCIISGVCGGIGEAFGWNANLIRLAFVAFTILGVGSPILIYIVLAFLLPKDY